MQGTELAQARENLCEVCGLLRGWHPDWRIVMSDIREDSVAVSVLVRVDGLKYKFSTPLNDLVQQKPEALAWFIGQVIQGALTR